MASTQPVSSTCMMGKHTVLGQIARLSYAQVCIVLYSSVITKSVINNAGSFQTPQLLELSGIGDSQILKGLNIDAIVDLPSVGCNLRR